MKRFLKFLFTVVAITGVMASCSDKGNDPEPGGKGELILTASTDEITADGIDAVTFTVTYDGDDVTSSAVIKQSNGAVVEGAEFVATAAGTYKFTAEYDEVTSNEVSVKADISLTAIVLSVDKNEIVNDGIDAATFTVTLGGEDITSSSELRVNNTPMDGVEFTNRTKGRYTFMAVYEGRVSNQIAIQVVDAELVLSIDKSLVIADGEDAAVLTAMYGGLDVTDEVEVRNNQNKVVPTTLVFDIWSNPNSYLLTEKYKFKAKYEGLTSNEVALEVHDMPMLEIKGDKLYLTPGETATFTVTRGDEDVTDQCAFREVGASTDLADNTYSSSTLGEHKVYAYLKDFDNTMPEYRASGKALVSVIPSVNGDPVFDKSKTLHKNIALITMTGAWCAPCATSKKYLDDLGKDRNTHITRMYIYDCEHAETSAPAILCLDNDLYYNVKSQLVNRFGAFAGWPTHYIDFDRSQYSYFPIGTIVSDNAEGIYNSYITRPAMTGIKVDPVINGNNVDFTVTVGAQEAGTYYVGAFLVEDNVVARHLEIIEGISSDKFVLNYNCTNVFRNKATTSIYGDELGAIAEGATKTTTTYSMPINSQSEVEHLSLQVYTLYEKGDQMVVANIVKVPIDRATGYLYE